mgnify:CR=1 FL=1
MNPGGGSIMEGIMEIIRSESRQAVMELIESAGLKAGDLMVIGCSSSEILGERIGRGSNPMAAQAVFDGVYPVLERYGIELAAQCCEHLNRALILERETAVKRLLPIVNVVPMPKAGGSFATAVYEGLKNPVAVEELRADAGMDIGDTLIGMHLKQVAVPVRVSVKRIGRANLVCARTRPKYIGGERAQYNDALR